MKNILARRAGAVLVSLATISAGMVAMAGTASAATGSCGSGYGKIASYKITRSWADPYVGGYIDVYYSSSAGKNCAIARPISSWSGKAGNIWVCMSTTTSPWARDCDGLGSNQNFRYYAGPIYIKARNQCIDVKGGLNKRPGDNSPYNGGAFGVHCG